MLLTELSKNCKYNRFLLVASVATYTINSEHVLQTLIYACQRMADDRLLREYHVPPVSASDSVALNL